MKYKTIFFDLDDTLCDDSAAWITCARNAAGLATARYSEIDADLLSKTFLDISERYWTGTNWLGESRPIADVRLEQWSQALTKLGHGDLPDLAEQVSIDYGRRRSRDIELSPDAVPTLIKLREMGFCLALITNGLAMTHVEKVEHLGLEPLFDHVLIAGVVGHFKPDARIFHHALERCKCSPEEALMVGDDLENDIDGAQQVGIGAIWFNPSGQLRPASATTPTGGEIRNISDLLQILE